MIFSSTPIPGNEKAVARVMNELSTRGAKIINSETHVSGHACREEIKLMYALTQPKYAVPVHGEFRHRQANAEIAKELGVPKGNVFMLRSGDVLSLSDRQGQVNATVPHGGILVDGLGVGDVGNIVLRDRQNLSRDGIIVIAMTLEKSSGKLLSGPEIISRGFVYMRDSEDLLVEAKNIAVDAARRAEEAGGSDWSRIRYEIREELGSYFWQRMKRSPVILPVIMEVEY